MKHKAMRGGEGGHHYLADHLVARFWGGAEVWNPARRQRPGV